MRVNLSIPDAVKERMDRHPSINWSQTATEAFINKMNTIEAQMKPLDMIGVTARLSAQKACLETEMEAAGYKAGSEWAMKSANYTELSNLEKACSDIDDYDQMIRVITDDGNSDEGSIPEYFGNNFSNTYFVCGFVGGAVDVFEKTGL